MLAECYLEAGRLDDAARTWFRANQNENSDAVDTAIYAVHGPVMAVRRRAELRHRIREGEVERAAELLALDRRWDYDWWSSARNRVQVVGPLCAYEDPQSWIGYSAGVQFTQADVAARAAHPFWSFASDGALVRERMLPTGSMAREGLQIAGDRAVWATMPERALLPERGRFEQIPETSSRRFVLYGPDDHPRLFDAESGERRPDPWLERASRDLRTRTKAAHGNWTVLLSDDLRHLLAIPDEAWVRNPDAKPDPDYERRIDEQNAEIEAAIAAGKPFPSFEDRPPAGAFVQFDVGGRKYDRKDHGLVYTRGAKAPKAFVRAEVSRAGRRTGERLLTLAAEPLLLSSTGHELRLVDLAGKVRLQVDVAETSALWRYGSVDFDDLRVDEGLRQLWFASSRLPSAGATTVDSLHVATWDLATNQLTDMAVPGAEMFRTSGPTFEPVRVLPVAP